MPVNLQENVTGILAILQAFNGMTDSTAFTGGVVGIGILAGVFFISFLIMKAYTYERAFAPSAFLSAIVSILLYNLGLLPANVMFIAISLVLIALFLLYLERGKEEV